MINPLHVKEGRAAIEVPTSTVTAMAGNSVMTGGMVTSTPRSGSPADYFCVPLMQGPHGSSGDSGGLFGYPHPLLR